MNCQIDGGRFVFGPGGPCVLIVYFQGHRAKPLAGRPLAGRGAFCPLLERVRLGPVWFSFLCSCPNKAHNL